LPGRALRPPAWLHGCELPISCPSR
jgi:hypothetical protein